MKVRYLGYPKIHVNGRRQILTKRNNRWKEIPISTKIDPCLLFIMRINCLYSEVTFARLRLKRLDGRRLTQYVIHMNARKTRKSSSEGQFLITDHSVSGIYLYCLTSGETFLLRIGALRLFGTRCISQK